MIKNVTFYHQDDVKGCLPRRAGVAPKSSPSPPIQKNVGSSLTFVAMLLIAQTNTRVKPFLSL
jgi:hypothetical protein